MEYEIVCAQMRSGICGFRVHDRYFVEKTRFAPGICPRDGAPVTVVQKGTNTNIAEMVVDLTTGRIENLAL